MVLKKISSLFSFLMVWNYKCKKLIKKDHVQIVGEKCYT